MLTAKVSEAWEKAAFMSAKFRLPESFPFSCSISSPAFKPEKERRDRKHLGRRSPTVLESRAGFVWPLRCGG